MPERAIEFVCIVARMLWIQSGHIVFVADAAFIRSWRTGRP